MVLLLTLPQRELLVLILRQNIVRLASDNVCTEGFLFKNYIDEQYFILHLV